MNPCLSYTAPNDASDYTYLIGTGPYTFTVPAWTKGDNACSYSETIAFTPNHAAVSLNSRTVKVVTGDKSLDGTSQTFTVTSTLTSDPFSGSDNGYTFKIIFTDPCKSATLRTPTVSNFAVDDGASKTQDFTDLSDTHGTDYGSPFFCGLRTFTFKDSNNAAVSWLTVAQQSGGTTYRITAAPTSTNTELQKAHTITMTVASATYSANQNSVTATFTVTVNTPACNCA